MTPYERGEQIATEYREALEAVGMSAEPLSSAISTAIVEATNDEVERRRVAEGLAAQYQFVLAAVLKRHMDEGKITLRARSGPHEYAIDIRAVAAEPTA